MVRVVSFGRDEDAVESNVQHADAVRQTLHFERNAALEAVAPFDLHRQTHFAAGLDRHFGLLRRGHDVAGFDEFGQPACRLAHHFLAVEDGAGDQLERRRFGRDGCVRFGEESDARAVFVGGDRRGGSAEAGRQVLQPNLNGSVEVVAAVGA